MKRIMFLFATLFVCGALWSQKTVTPQVLTVVYATSDDGFLNVRERPSSKAKVLTTLPLCFHGLGRGILLERGEKWSKVRVENSIEGWVYNKYMGEQNWYTGNGKPKLVAKQYYTPLYTDNYVDEGPKFLPYGTVKQGTIIADEYDADEVEGYYVLKTGHDYLFIKKEDVTVE